MSGETVIQRDKRFVTTSEYCKLTGLSASTVRYMLNTNQLSYITTEGGLKRIDTKSDGPENAALLERIEGLETMIRALCRQFNTAL